MAGPFGHPTARVAALLVATIILLAAAEAAQAVPRYAVPGGDTTSADCATTGANCSLNHVLQDVVGTGDEVIVTPGTHDVGAMGVYIKSGVTGLNIHGKDGQARPRITADAPSYFTFHTCAASNCAGDGTSLRHLTIENRNMNGALTFFGGSAGHPFTIDDLEVIAGSQGPAILGFAQTGLPSEAVIRNTTAWSVGPGAGRSAITSEVNLTMRNVTAVATGDGASGFVQTPNCNDGIGCTGDATATVFNSILAGASGTAADIRTTSSTNGCASICYGNVAVDYSNFDNVSNCTGCSLSGPGSPHNSMAQPLLANVGAGNFHELTGSPTIDAGVDDPANGTTDPDGDPRKFGAATDMGADEYTGPSGGGGGPGGGGTTDTTAPVLASALLTNTVFAVNRRGSSETAVAARRAKRGTTFKYTLSEPARVLFTIQRALPGRRVRGRCTKPTRANRTKRKCTRYKLFGRFAQQSAAGQNSKKWSGKIGRKVASPGRYRATLIATDLPGNRSAAKRLRFRVVRR